MKTFFYKTLIIFVLVFVLFQITIGAQIRQIKTQIENIKSKENIEIIKSKIRDELKTAVNKENYLTQEDAKLINDFLNKIKKELDNSK
tara:strand:- start:310 stop:573 length:264 start_codon:yes stop_codon:yes gene_type:complete